jgi:hypothetical protein
LIGGLRYRLLLQKALGLHRPPARRILSDFNTFDALSTTAAAARLLPVRTGKTFRTRLALRRGRIALRARAFRCSG